MAGTIRQAVLITAAIVGGLWIISLIRPAPAPPKAPIVGKDLSLGYFIAVEGTGTFRARLYEQGSGFSSGGSSTIRNILFIDKEGQGRWLVPDHGHEVSEHTVPERMEYGPDSKGAIAIFALIKPRAEIVQGGALKLFDPAGRSVQTVDEGVLEVNATTFTNDEISVIYRLRQNYVLATFQRSTLVKLRQTPVSVPEVKQADKNS